MNAQAPKTPPAQNAVMVVPGIMGSELVDANGDVAWGLKPSLLVKAWATRRLSALIPTDEELDGTPRLRPTRLLTSIFHDGPVRGLSAPVASMLV